MPIVVWLGAAMIIAALGTLAWAVNQGGPVLARSGGARRNLMADRPSDMRGMVLEQSATDRVVQPLVGSLAAKARRLTPAGSIETIEARLAQSGYASKWNVERVLAIKMVGATVLGGIAVLNFLASPSAGTLLLVVVAAALPWFGIDIYLHGRAHDRQKVIERELPDVLDQLTVTVEAGLGFEAAVARVAASSEGPLAEEFGRTLQDVQLGLSRQDALAALAKRTAAPDLRQLIVALDQADRLGVPLAHALRVQAGEMRIRRKIRAEEEATKLPVKLVFPLILCIMPALFVALLGPAIVRWFEHGGVLG
jgi:tight adherence protein C